MKEILLNYGIPEETVCAFMILYKNTRSMVRSPDGYTPYFEITTGVLQGDTLAPFLFIICFDYILKTSLDNNRELGFTLTERKSRRYHAEQIVDTEYDDYIAVTNNPLKDANTLLLKIESAAKEIGLCINTDKTKYININQNNNMQMKIICGSLINQVEDFKYLGSYIRSTKRYVNIRIAKAWVALNSMNTIWKLKLSKNLKRQFFRAAVESVLVYGSVTWTLTTALENNIGGTYTRMLRAVTNKSWRDHLSNEQLYGDITKISKSIRMQRLRFAGNCWRSKYEVASDLLLW